MRIDPTDRHPRASRRVVVGAAAWTVPTIVVAAAAPAHATSGTRQLTITRWLDVKNGVAYGGDFRHDVRNDGPAATEALQASVTITADDASVRGPAPYAVAWNWAYLGVAGTSATRTFLFQAAEQLTDGRGTSLDVEVYSDNQHDNGNLAPGSRSARVWDADGSNATYGPERFLDFADPSRRGRGLPPRAPRP